MASRFARALVLLLMAVTGACSSGPPPPEDTAAYAKTIEASRADKERYMREDPTTPITPAMRDVLLPLRYFPIDPSYNVPASLRLADERPVYEMPTSTGTIRRYQHVGTLQFVLQGQPMTLGAFVEDGQPIATLFVPFADLTTGKETYSAGRYLDLHPTPSGVYNIDFNTAYNPFCAYNSSYECPYPPPSNRLKLAVRAGEMTPSRPS